MLEALDQFAPNWIWFLKAAAGAFAISLILILFALRGFFAWYLKTQKILVTLNELKSEIQSLKTQLTTIQHGSPALPSKQPTANADVKPQNEVPEKNNVVFPIHR